MTCQFCMHCGLFGYARNGVPSFVWLSVLDYEQVIPLDMLHEIKFLTGIRRDVL
jgi:hypothetical protein